MEMLLKKETGTAKAIFGGSSLVGNRLSGNSHPGSAKIDVNVKILSYAVSQYPVCKLEPSLLLSWGSKRAEPL